MNLHQPSGAGKVFYNNDGNFAQSDDAPLPDLLNNLTVLDFNHDNFADILCSADFGTGGVVTLSYNDSPGASAPDV